MSGETKFLRTYLFFVGLELLDCAFFFQIGYFEEGKSPFIKSEKNSLQEKSIFNLLIDPC